MKVSSSRRCSRISSNMVERPARFRAHSAARRLLLRLRLTLEYAACTEDREFPYPRQSRGRRTLGRQIAPESAENPAKPVVISYFADITAPSPLFTQLAGGVLLPIWWRCDARKVERQGRETVAIASPIVPGAWSER